MARKKKSNKNFISSAIKKPGQLHRDLGVPQGQKISVSKIRAAAKGSGKTAQRARLALTLRKLPKRGGRKRAAASKKTRRRS